MSIQFILEGGKEAFIKNEKRITDLFYLHPPPACQKSCAVDAVGWETFRRLVSSFYISQKQIVAKIEEEQKIIEANKKLVDLFQQKIEAKIKSIYES